MRAATSVRFFADTFDLPCDVSKLFRCPGVPFPCVFVIKIQLFLFAPLALLFALTLRLCLSVVSLGLGPSWKTRCFWTPLLLERPLRWCLRVTSALVRLRLLLVLCEATLSVCFQRSLS